MISPPPRSPKHPLSFFIIILALVLPRISARFTWPLYPPCAQPILDFFAPGPCDLGQTGNDLNRTHSCLCSNREFLDSSATAVHIVCGCDDLTLTAEQLTRDCERTNTPAISGLNELIAIAMGQVTGGGGDGCVASPFAVKVENGTQAGNCSASASTASSASSEQKDCPKKAEFIYALAFGIPGAVLTAVAASVGTLQLLVYQKKLPEDASPWPMIRKSFGQWVCCLGLQRQKVKRPAAEWEAGTEMDPVTAAESEGSGVAHVP